MTVLEFYNNYNLHDSFSESLHYNESAKELVMDINFAFWMQKSYKDGEPENGIIRVTFRDVTEYQCHGEPTGAFVGILSTEIHNNELIIGLFDDETSDFFEMTINAACVDVSVI